MSGSVKSDCDQRTDQEVISVSEGMTDDPAPESARYIYLFHPLLDHPLRENKLWIKLA